MTIEYSSRFVKDLKALKGTPSFAKIKELAFDLIPIVETLDEIPHFTKLEGYDHYYRIRIGDYRIGFKMEDSTLVFMRVLHRKEIYRYFP
ncbi:MAG: type II toxin-antitoxin system RelE/ParE family toxin [Saprospiraceae bacterium]|nr:type II toxin-antitoxin system RelE/ParE family toxin [Saprospiraceae bacterium]